MTICITETYWSSSLQPVDRSQPGNCGQWSASASKQRVNRTFHVEACAWEGKTSTWTAWAQPIENENLPLPSHTHKGTRKLVLKRHGSHSGNTEICGWETLSIEDALPHLKEMADLPSADSLVFFLQKCKRERNLSYTQSVHAHMLAKGLEDFRELGNFLVPMFVECGRLASAQQVFDSLADRNEHSWTRLIQAYVDCGEFDCAFNLFEKMQESCVQPTVFTMQALLKACTRANDLLTGQKIHSCMVEERHEADPFVVSTLIDFYAKCGLFQEAHSFFDLMPDHDRVSWNALIGGYATSGLGDKALVCYDQMQHEGILPNTVTLFSCLKACSTLKDVARGHEIHVVIVREGFDADTHVAHSLVDMYAKCGAFEEALDVFNDLQLKGLVPWNALITGYVDQGLGHEALNSFRKMREKEVAPDAVSYMGTLGACAEMGAIDRGRELHHEAVAGGFEMELFVGNTLVDLYAKCGCFVDAWETFDKLPTRDVVSWNALLAGYARQGECDYVLECFERMKRDGIQPNGESFLSVLNVCSHAGSLDLGQAYYKEMVKDYGIMPTIKHYNCKIDWLGRAGLLAEAMEMIEDMPFRPDLATWRTVLGACRKWGKVELGRQAFDCAVTKWNEEHDIIFVLMSSIYADAHMWDEVELIDARRRKVHASVRAGKSWIEVGNYVHAFGCDITEHGLHKGGPNQQNPACAHGLKLPLVDSLSNVLGSILIRVALDFPLCRHCHMEVAHMSKTERKNILCRDARQLHAFHYGKCSCGRS